MPSRIQVDIYVSVCPRLVNGCHLRFIWRRRVLTLSCHVVRHRQSGVAVAVLFLSCVSAEILRCSTFNWLLAAIFDCRLYLTSRSNASSLNVLIDSGNVGIAFRIPSLTRVESEILRYCIFTYGQWRPSLIFDPRQHCTVFILLTSTTRKCGFGRRKFARILCIEAEIHVIHTFSVYI